MAAASTPAHGLHPTPAGSPFPPIAGYGFISDCEVAAIVVPSGSVERLCLPRMDRPSVAACMAAGLAVEHIAELQFAFPTCTAGVSFAAQMICRDIGIGRFPQVWSYLGAGEEKGLSSHGSDNPARRRRAQAS